MTELKLLILYWEFFLNAKIITADRVALWLLCGMQLWDGLYSPLGVPVSVGHSLCTEAWYGKGSGELAWLRIWSSDGIFWTCSWNLNFCNIRIYILNSWMIVYQLNKEDISAQSVVATVGVWFSSAAHVNGNISFHWIQSYHLLICCLFFVPYHLFSNYINLNISGCFVGEFYHIYSPLSL
jgi:hypothetical protein